MLQAKKEIYDIKQQRLYLAQDEYNHLNNVLSTLNTSRTSCKYSTTDSGVFLLIGYSSFPLPELMWFLLTQTVINSNYIVSYVARIGIRSVQVQLYFMGLLGLLNLLDRFAFLLTCFILSLISPNFWSTCTFPSD